MNVKISFTAQLSLAAGGLNELSLDLPEKISVLDLLNLVSESFGEDFREIVLKAGQVAPNLIVILADEQVEADEVLQLYERAHITLLTPMAGG